MEGRRRRVERARDEWTMMGWRGGLRNWRRKMVVQLIMISDTKVNNCSMAILGALMVSHAKCPLETCLPRHMECGGGSVIATKKAPAVMHHLLPASLFTSRRRVSLWAIRKNAYGILGLTVFGHSTSPDAQAGCRLTPSRDI